ncbi:Rxlr effector protein, partial [Globisporangium splendens]
MAVQASQHEKWGATDPVHTNEREQVNAGVPDKSGTIEEGTTPSRAEGSRKDASTETAPVERYEALATKLRVSSNAVNRVEIEYEVRLAEETKASPWGSQTSTNSQTNVKEKGTQPFTFQSNKYSEEEQRNMIRHCKQKFECTPTLREPTTMEWEIMLAIVEGEPLIRHLPQFLRRVCDGDTLFRFQNTTAAQVEGELADDEIMSKLPRKPATFTSAAEIKESVSDSIDKQKQPLQPAAENPHASEENKPSENANPVTPDKTNTSSPQPNSNPKNLTKNASFTVGTGIPVHAERQTELNPNRNGIMDWDGEYTPQDVMDANGLAEATTTPTGNCQFYAVAEAMLQITHDDNVNEKMLETTASRIKQSMNAAARLNFDLEFPEGTHLGILEALGRGDRKMSPKEKRADVLDYFSDIASSSSSRSSTLPGSLWGGPESLRMAAKALQRKIFVLIETTLHFRTLNEPSSLANMTSSSLAKHLQGSERNKTEFKTNRSGQFDSEPVTEDPMEDSDNSSLEELVWTPPLEEREKFEPNQLNGHHGWSFASQENQLVVYHSPTTELPPQPRKRDRDETLMLTAKDGDVTINLNSPNVPLKKTKTLSRRLAIEGDSMQKPRDLERMLQEHWEGFQEQWKEETKCPFPLLSSNHDVWTQAALNEWERILAMLKTSPGPHHVLNHLRGPTLVDLTQVLREQVIEEGLKRLLYRTDQAETKVWITGWFDRIATATTKQQRAALLNSKEDWSTLGKMKYGGLEVLRLCHLTQQEKLSRYIICTVVYEEELQTFRSSDAEDPDNLYEAIEDFCAILKQTRELKAAFKSGEELSEWSALSVIMAQVTMEVDSVEPSRERTKWLEDLKGALTAEKYDIIYLQETRITTAKEERRLRHYWNRIWGITNLDEPTSFWSIHPDATGGVAILTNPKTISETQLIEESKWTNRTVAIKSEGVVWINVYAPNKKSEREHFFRRLNEELQIHRAAAVLGGDFDCVIDKQRDCAVQREAIELPKRYSDHQAVVLHMKWTSQPQRPRKVNKCRHPIRTSRPDLVRTGVQKAIVHELELMQIEGPIEWSHLEQRIIKALLRVSRAEKRQVRRYQQKLEDQQHRPATRSRRQLIEGQANAAREAAEFKFGKYMQATQGDVHHFFRRITNWQRDQTISRLEPTPGRYHPPNASLADIMGTEWHQITGQSHATVPPHKAELRFDALVYIPETRKVAERQNQDLMAPITQKESEQRLLQGLRGRDGRSFGAGIQQHPTRGTHAKIIRSRNRYSVAQERRFAKSPLDYRPITLLTTTYKLFAKVLATRLQDILLGIIGEEQQGFVRDRLMENAILIMQATLDKAYHNGTEGLDDAPGIAMLDFMKAYDTLDRDFLYLVLSKFGFGRQFVDLVRRMHSDTTAQYLVNGELSREWEVKSGIRQGCPLAPLLFIVAAEILALAVQQDPYLEGIRVTRSGAEPHLISTFVDDSAVFLKQGKQLPRLMQLLTEFGQQSGLHVQPTKSSYISLNTAVVQEQRCGIPILKHGETVRYLGIQIGTRNIAQANGEDRLQKLRTRLIIAAKVSNSVVRQDKSQNWGCCAISPKERSQHAQTRLYQTNNIHRLGWEYLDEDLVAAEGRNLAWKDDLKRQMESLLPTVDLEWRSDERAGVYFGRKPEQTIHQLSEETRAFWPSFQWNDNPWIIDSQGEQYTVKTVPFLKECNLASFNGRREEERVFSVRLPTMTATLTFKRMTTLRKLVISIILCSPEIEIDAGNQLISHQEPLSKKHTKREYKWISNGMETIIAVRVSERSHTDYTQMQRQANGVLWTVTDWTGDATCQQGVAMIEEEIKTIG